MIYPIVKFGDPVLVQRYAAYLVEIESKAKLHLDIR